MIEHCGKSLSKNRKGTKRIARTATIHESIEFCMNALSDIAIRRILCITNDGSHSLFHLLLASFVADLPQTETLLSFQQRRMSSKPGNLCVLDQRSPYCFQRVKN